MENLLKLIQTGGPVVWILICFSIISMSVFIYKVWQFWVYFNFFGQRRSEDALILIEKDKNIDAFLLVKQRRTPRSKSLTHSLKIALENSLSLKQHQEESIRFAKSILKQLNSHLRILEVIATLAPLLGLFGTVLGMIAAFQAMEAAGSQVDPSVLSGGIWQALLTTAIGLGVAIPVSLAHSWLERRVESEAENIEDDLARLFTNLAQQSENPLINNELRRSA